MKVDSLYTSPCLQVPPCPDRANVDQCANALRPIAQGGVGQYSLDTMKKNLGQLGPDGLLQVIKWCQLARTCMQEWNAASCNQIQLPKNDADEFLETWTGVLPEEAELCMQRLEEERMQWASVYQALRPAEVSQDLANLLRLAMSRSEQDKQNLQEKVNRLPINERGCLLIRLQTLREVRQCMNVVVAFDAGLLPTEYPDAVVDSLIAILDKRNPMTWNPVTSCFA